MRRRRSVRACGLTGGGIIKKFIRVNERIRVPEVRLIGPEGNQLGIVSTDKAREIAVQNELDLVEVAPQSVPPVCRIMDFSKFKYDQEKKEREAKKHQKAGRIKEIRLHPNIDEHDFQIKVKQALGFIKKKDRVKVDLFFRGRQIEHMDLGRKLIDKFIADTRNDALLEKEPAMEGRIITMLLAPKK
ncbi:MAG TPA: translation initiation factor IF-3 [Candidatus Omnitrophota bacterium]|nr:translation initiation factor IF-3 [Candidatus Omnitrophota bacterium]HQJ15399.1 translation initiation factor IF-3 [Candidatus Omnitrophota bacterium]